MKAQWIKMTAVKCHYFGLCSELRISRLKAKCFNQGKKLLKCFSGWQEVSMCFLFRLPKVFKSHTSVFERLNIHDALWCYRNKINPITQNKREVDTLREVLCCHLYPLQYKILACHEGWDLCSAFFQGTNLSSGFNVRAVKYLY